MKRSDIITICLIAGIGVIASYVILNMVLGDPSEFSVDYKYIDEISADVTSPSEINFNSQAINPTVEVYVGECLDSDGDGTISSAERAACIAGSDGSQSEADAEAAAEAGNSDTEEDSDIDTGE